MNFIATHNNTYGNKVAFVGANLFAISSEACSSRTSSLLQSTSGLLYRASMSFIRVDRLLLLLALLLVTVDSAAFELRVQQVTDDVYALVGDTGPRTYDNHALNNTLGFVVTPEGVVLVDSGATPAGAQLIEQTIAR